MSKHLHIGANSKDDVAELVLLPGDPLRAEFIANTYLEDVIRYNTVRGMYGFTGTYKGKRVSVQGTGMGMPSAGIYIHELITEYGAKKLVRIGSCGSIKKGVEIKDTIIAMSACTNSKMIERRFFGHTYAPTASFDLLLKAYNLAEAKGIRYHVGSLVSSDLFYDDTDESIFRWAEYGVLGVEMEAAELFTLAKKYDVDALAMCTVSDNLITGEETTAEERQETFTNMMEIALEL